MEKALSAVSLTSAGADLVSQSPRPALAAGCRPVAEPLSPQVVYDRAARQQHARCKRECPAHSHQSGRGHSRLVGAAGGEHGADGQAERPHVGRWRERDVRCRSRPEHGIALDPGSAGKPLRERLGRLAAPGAGRVTKDQVVVGDPGDRGLVGPVEAEHLRPSRVDGGQHQDIERVQGRKAGFERSRRRPERDSGHGRRAGGIGHGQPRRSAIDQPHQDVVHVREGLAGIGVGIAVQNARQPQGLGDRLIDGGGPRGRVIGMEQRQGDGLGGLGDGLPAFAVHGSRGRVAEIDDGGLHGPTWHGGRERDLIDRVPSQLNLDHVPRTALCASPSATGTPPELAATWTAWTSPRPDRLQTRWRMATPESTCTITDAIRPLPCSRISVPAGTPSRTAISSETAAPSPSRAEIRTPLPPALDMVSTTSSAGSSMRTEPRDAMGIPATASRSISTSIWAGSKDSFAE